MYRASSLQVILVACLWSTALVAAAAGARCGVVQVPEAHSKPGGRKIGLHIVVLPATGAQRDGKRAQFDLEGGPGSAATDFLEFYAGEGAPYREKRDIVLADMRGTGLKDCAADSACRAMGDMRANLARALERAGRVSGMTARVFLEKLRNRLYSPESRARVPYLLAQAAAGDLGKFTGAGGSGRVFADGLYLSITCNESFARIDIGAATTFGAYRLERQRGACEHWPKAASAPQLMREPDSRVPVLFIAGELDPVSPADWAQEAAAHFSSGKLVLDGLSGLDTCLDAVAIRFFDSGSAQPLDTSCFVPKKGTDLFNGNQA